jgi:hypothetical protein
MEIRISGSEFDFAKRVRIYHFWLPYEKRIRIGISIYTFYWVRIPNNSVNYFYLPSTMAGTVILFLDFYCTLSRYFCFTGWGIRHSHSGDKFRGRKHSARASEHSEGGKALNMGWRTGLADTDYPLSHPCPIEVRISESEFVFAKRIRIYPLWHHTKNGSIRIFKYTLYCVRDIV